MLLLRWSTVIALLQCVLMATASDVQVMMQASDEYKKLTANQKQCAAGNILSVCRDTKCKDKDCFCADPQFMSDYTDTCMLYFGDTNPTIYSIDTYNGIMVFFANECKTFTPQLKVRLVFAHGHTYLRGVGRWWYSS